MDSDLYPTDTFQGEKCKCTFYIYIYCANAPYSLNTFLNAQKINEDRCSKLQTLETGSMRIPKRQGWIPSPSRQDTFWRCQLSKNSLWKQVSTSHPRTNKKSTVPLRDHRANVLLTVQEQVTLWPDHPLGTSETPKETCWDPQCSL